MQHIAENIPSIPKTAPVISAGMTSYNNIDFPESADCPICMGIGFVKLNVPVIHKHFGRAFPCACRNDAIRARRGTYLREICRVPTRYAYSDLTTCDSPQGLGDEIAKAVRASNGEQVFVTLSGVYGSGKTTALTAAVNYAVSENLVGVYVTMADLLDHLRRAYSPNSDVDADKFWETMVKANVLALDEIDRWNPTPWARERFFKLIDSRYSATSGLTLMATNKPIHGTHGILEGDPGYFESRIREQGEHNIGIMLPALDRRRSSNPRQHRL